MGIIKLFRYDFTFFFLLLLGLWTVQILCQGGKKFLFTQTNLKNMFSYAFYGFICFLSEFILFFSPSSDKASAIWRKSF